MLESWDWPSASGFFKEDIHPNESTTPNWTNKGQGITADGFSWFFGTFDPIDNPKVWHRAVTDDIDASYPTPNAGDEFAVVDSGYLESGKENHFGGIDFHDGDVVVAMHYDTSAKASRILRFSTKSPPQTPIVSFKDGTSLPNTTVITDGDIGQMPWVAVLSGSGWCMTSLFAKHDDPSPDPLRLYFYDLDAASWGVSGTIPFVGRLDVFEFNPTTGQPVTRVLRRIQGADFGRKEHLYLISDMEDSDGGGVYGIDIISGFIMLRLRPSLFGAPESEGGNAPLQYLTEYQDLCIFDTSNYSVHSKSEGVLHLLIQENRDGVPPDDAHWILHLGHPDAEKV